MIKALHFLLALTGVLGAVSMLPAAHAQDVAQGKSKAAMCIGCHGIAGYQASFPEVYRVPMISGQNAKYIVASLNAYKKGERKHPSMRGIAGSMTDADMADLAAYYEQHGSAAVKPVADVSVPAPSVEVAALLTKGACSSCHGPNYSKPIDPGYPKIGGQHADYLAAALRAYASNDHPKWGRANAIMAGQVKQFSAPELKAMAKYIGSLPGELRTVPQNKFK